MQKSSCIPPPVPPPLCREQQGWYGKETREGLIHPITFSWWWQNSDPYRCDQQGKNNSLTLQQSNAQPLHGLVSTAGHESNICKYTQEWQNETQKHQRTNFQVTVHTYSSHFPTAEIPVEVSKVPAGLPACPGLFHSQHSIYSVLNQIFFSEQSPYVHSNKHPKPSVLVTFMKQLKIDLLLQNSYWESSLENAISPKPQMQQENHINRICNENSWVWLKADSGAIFLTFSLEFCLQGQLLIPIKLFHLLTRQWHLSRYSLYSQLNFLLRKKCHFSICAFEKVCYCFPSPGSQDLHTVSWTWL